MVELVAVSGAIGKFTEALIKKLKRGENSLPRIYLFLTLYYLSKQMEMIDKRIDKEVEKLDTKID